MSEFGAHGENGPAPIRAGSGRIHTNGSLSLAVAPAPGAATGRARAARRWARLARWIAYHEWVVVILLAPLLLAARPARLAFAAAFLVPALWLLVARVRRAEAATGYDRPLFWYVLLLPLCLLPVTDGGLALPKLLGLVLGLALMRAVARAVAGPAQLATLGYAIVGTLVGVALVSLAATDWTSDKLLPIDWLYTRLPRLPVALPHSLQGGIHPNEVGGTLALLLPLAVTIVLAQWGRRRLRIPLLASVALGAAVLGLTQSRMAFLGLACGLGVVLVGWLVLRRRRWSVLLAAAVLLAGGAALRLLGPRLATGSGIPGANPNALDTLPGRIELWERALLMLHDFPFTGVGLGQFPAVLQRLYPPFQFEPDAWVPHAHNFYLQVALDLGIPAAAAFFVLIAVALVRSALVLVRGPGQQRLLALGCLGGLVAFLVFGLADAIAPGAKPWALLWLVLGVLEATRRHTAAVRSERPARERQAAPHPQ